MMPQMKKFIIGIFLALIMVSPALADAFQFVRRANGAYVSGAAVHFEGKLLGYTDNYGRIIISLAPGKKYAVDVSFLGQSTSVDVTITGNPQLQVVNL